MIEVSHLSKRYGELAAVRDASFTAPKGQILGFLGPNGAGKTTTMRIITGFLPATSGTVRVEGFDVFTQSSEVRRRIGYLPESPPLYNDMTVAGYLRFVAKLKGMARGALAGALDRVLETCGLTGVRDRLLGHLSKGFRQRVGLAQALIHDPPVLILDEPTIGLDPRQIIEIRSLIKTLGGKRTVVLSTHILPEVSQVCDKVVIINDGRIVVEDHLARHGRRRARGRRDGDVSVRNVLTIGGRELRSYFSSPVAYVLLAAYLALAGYFFFALLSAFNQTLQMYSMMRNPEMLSRFNLNQMVVVPLLHNMSVLLIFIVPAISMRMFPEEKRSGTYELLLTSPVRVGEIVLGKFLGGLVLVLLMVALSGYFGRLLVSYGNPEVPMMLSGYLGLALMATVFLAVGTLISSFTDNVVIAYVGTLFALLVLYTIGWLGETMQGAAGRIVRYASITEHFSELAKGVIDTKDLVYFATLLLIGLFLTLRS